MASNKSQKTKGASHAESPNRRKPKKAKKHRVRRFFTYLSLILLFCICGIFVVFAGYAFAVIKSTPPLDVNAVLTLNQPSSLYDNNGDFMDNLHSTEERYVIESDEIPQSLKDAFISIEDERFMTHKGIDLKRIAGSALLDVKKIITKQKGLHGASTITQQLIKNTVLTNDVSIERKIKEMYLALNLEQKLTKDQIITAYLNTIPMGGTAYGVEAAALLYFSKSASDLSLVECAYLAGITQAPSYYSAYNEHNTEDPAPYINRTIVVLDKMLEKGYISQEEHDTAVNDINNGNLVFKKSKIDYKLNYEWFIYPAISQVKKDLMDKYGYSEEEAANLIAHGGLQIYTTMDRHLQDFTQATLDDYNNLGITNPETYNEDGVPLLQASATIVNYKTGAVVAMVGGRGNQQPQSTNRAYNALKPIGSSTKPLTVYGPGINEKIITAATPIDDAPFEDNKLDNGNSYNPKNSPNVYNGLTTAREGVKYSKNVVSVKIADMIGLNTGISYGEKLGLKYNSASKSSIAAVALGEFNNDPNDLDGGNTFILANAFGTFGNGGNYTKPILYTKVEDSNGRTILENNNPSQTSVFSQEAAYIMYDILKGPITYNATGAKWGDMPVAGKTGTTTASNNLWFSGLTPYLSASVWIGYDIPSTLYGSSSGCAVLWGKLMAEAHSYYKYSVTDIKKPEKVVSVSVCKDSGVLPSGICKNDPRGNRIYTEYFISGTEPTDTCEVHCTSEVNVLNGKTATSSTPSILKQSVVYIKKDNPNPVTLDYPYVYTSSAESVDNTVGYDEETGPVEFYPSPEEINQNSDSELPLASPGGNLNNSPQEMPPGPGVNPENVETFPGN